jgi:hypothetical protein
MAIKILASIAGLLALLALFIATRPADFHLERAIVINAPAEAAFTQVNDFHHWADWSPFEKLDPNMKKTYDGPPKGVGATYAWQGNNKVGQGKMTIKDAKPPASITYELQFIKPFAAVASTEFTLLPDGDKASKVTWAMNGTNNLMGKAFSVFMNMDRTIGADFERGLRGLKSVSEGEAAKQVEAAKIAAKQEAEAAATAAAAAKSAAPQATADTKRKRPARR